MTLFLYFFAFMFYIIIAGAPYTKIVDSNWYWSIALLGIVTQASWLGIAKLATDHKDIMFKGLYFDLMITMVYLILPILVFNVSVTRNNLIGILLILIGLVVTKV